MGRAPAPPGGVETLTWPELTEAGAQVAFTTTRGGVSEDPYWSLNLGLHVGDDPERVLENRALAAAALGAPLSDLVFGEQVHGTRVAVVTDGDRGRGSLAYADALGGVDALVTACRGPVLVTLVGDCSPVLLFDPQAKVVATVHAGWRGATRGIMRATVETMVSLGADVDRLLAVVGPTISPDTYVVGPDVADAATQALGAQASEVLLPHHDRWLFDVAGANVLQLASLGVASTRIRRSGFTTGDGRFFSARSAPATGRCGLLARLR